MFHIYGALNPAHSFGNCGEDRTLAGAIRDGRNILDTAVDVLAILITDTNDDPVARLRRPAVGRPYTISIRPDARPGVTI